MGLCSVCSFFGVGLWVLLLLHVTFLCLLAIIGWLASFVPIPLCNEVFLHLFQKNKKIQAYIFGLLTIFGSLW
jgi:hypothetical protein